MEPGYTERQVTSGGVSQSAQFAISMADQTHIMTILRDTLYTDRVLAVLREYSANAWDAHRQSGKADLPIKVTIPTDMDPTLRIRDFGSGMSQEDVFRIYSQYGASTKRDDNIAVGMMGIGSKSGFAYSDTFTVVSWNGGMKRIYIALLDETDTGTINLLAEEPCGEETGIEIQIPVRHRDMWEFNKKATDLFRYFKPLPDINIELPTVQNQTLTEHGFVNGFGYNGGWVAVMGCIPYRVNIEQIQENLQQMGLWDAALRMNGGMYFDIGEVQISASREELKYSEKTKKILTERFYEVIQEYTDQVIQDLTLEGMNPWEKRLKGVDFMNRMCGVQVPLPLELQEFTKSEIRLSDVDDKGEPCAPKTFTVINSRGDAVEGRLHMVRSDVRLIIKDDPRPIQGFELPYGYNYIIRPYRKATIDKVREELAHILDINQLTGIPQIDISTCTWKMQASCQTTEVNVKHLVNQFKLVGSRNCRPLSDNWEVAEWEPSDEDVFVIIERFEPVGYWEFYSDYQKDVSVAKVLGLEMPPVYGYKTTNKHPVSEKDCKGTPYKKWRKDFLKKLATHEVRYALTQWRQAKALEELGNYRLRCVGGWEKVLKDLTDLLGADHIIPVRIQKAFLAEKYLDKLPTEFKDALSNFAEVVEIPKITLNDLCDDYPLMKATYTDMTALWGNNAAIWLDYIHLVDESKKKFA